MFFSGSTLINSKRRRARLLKPGRSRLVLEEFQNFYKQGTNLQEEQSEQRARGCAFFVKASMQSDLAILRFSYRWVRRDQPLYTIYLSAVAVLQVAY